MIIDLKILKFLIIICRLEDTYVKNIDLPEKYCGNHFPLVSLTIVDSCGQVCYKYIKKYSLFLNFNYLGGILSNERSVHQTM